MPYRRQGDPDADDPDLRVPRPPHAAERAAFPFLTGREHDILAMVAAGYTNAAIADRLRLSPKTVRNYVSTVLAKLDVTTRADAARRARDAGLTGDPG